MTQVKVSLGPKRPFNESDLDPPPPKRVVHKNTHQEGSPPCFHMATAADDEHDVEVCLLVADIFDHYGKLRTGEEQDHTQGSRWGRSGK